MPGDRPTKSRVSRRIRRKALSPALLLGCAWTTGCVFFDNSYDACFGLSDCPTNEATSTAGGKNGTTDELGEGGSDAPTGRGHEGSGGRESSGGGGDSPSAGGTADEGGGGSGAASGGSPDSFSGGADSASGGEPNGGAGGTQGSGGMPGSGGDPGAGGDPGSGGVSGSGSDTGSGGAVVPPARLVVNELRGGSGGFIELYNPSDLPFDLSTISITVEASGEPKWAAACSLAQVGSLDGKAFLEIRSGTNCAEESVCVKQCSESVAPGEKVYVLDSNSEGNGVLLEFLYPSNIGLGIGQSYSAKWDGAGKDDFEVSAHSPGTSNAL